MAVVGAGAMGAGIAQCFASSGWHVRLVDKDPQAVVRARARIASSLEKQVAKGRLLGTDAQEVLARVVPAEEVGPAVADARIVVEAVFEDLDLKRALYARLEEAAPDAVLATNTSSFLVQDIADATTCRDRVVGLHFFFPAHVNPLVEVVRTGATGEAAFRSAWDAVVGIGKHALAVGDAPGFCVNRFLLPWMNEACRLLDEGVGDPRAIDARARADLGVPMGPFAVMNLSGLKVCHHAVATLGRHLGPAYAPSPSLARQAESGEPWDLAPAGRGIKGAAGGGEAPGKAGGQEGPVADPPPLPEAASRRLRGVVWRVARDIVSEAVATPEAVDAGARHGLAWPKGPFQQMAERGASVATDVAALPPAWSR